MLIASAAVVLVNWTLPIGCPFNVTTSGGGNYSPPQQDDFPVFGMDAWMKHEDVVSQNYA